MKQKQEAPRNVGQTDLESTLNFKLPKKQPLIRTTLRISREGHDAIRTVAKLQGTKNADVIDALIVIFQRLKEVAPNISLKSDPEKKAIRKTYVVGKNTILRVSQLAKDLQISRDQFIDSIARVLMRVVARENSKKNDNYKSVNNELIKPFWSYAEDIEEKIKAKLGEDDIVVNRFGHMCVHIMNLSMAIDDFLSSGEPIPEY